MRNRAKCAECKEILESLSWGDVVTCKCGLQTIWGGSQALHTSSRDYSKFLRVDDEGVEQAVIYKDIEHEADALEAPSLPSGHDIATQALSPIASSPLDELQAFKDYLDRWPVARLHSPCSYADLRDLSGLVLSALQSPPL